ncbi:MAG: flavin-containing monooxygenase [Novosphingobium sp.]
MPDCDLLIVGAGISGIAMAAYARMKCPGIKVTLVERRSRIGGTWDLFRYPGIRSDSDMHTFGYSFEPWTNDRVIADGQTILDYLDHVADKYAITPDIRFDTNVLAADFREGEALWHVTMEDASGQTRTTSARFLYLAAGYYDHDTAHNARLQDLDQFSGTIVNPQFWPADLDYSGKRVLVVGSGATAVTLIPAMARSAAHVTMLQRTPTWMGAQPATDRTAKWLRAILPAPLAHKINRKRHILIQQWQYKACRKWPRLIGNLLQRAARKELGPAYDPRDWSPPYGPWEQRLCLVPDGDLFAAIREGKASIVTGKIDRFDATGVNLADGQHIDADVVVTATGLKLALGGKIAVSVDGKRVSWRKHFFYRAAMFSNIPNLAVGFGYLSATWTLRAELTARFICDVLNTMMAKGATIVRPVLPENHGLIEEDVYHLSAGYIERARAFLPKSATDIVWRLNQDYVQDLRFYRTHPVDDGILSFTSPDPVAAQIAVDKARELS